MSGGGEEPPAGPDWARIRRDYEAGCRPLAGIAHEAGLTRQGLAALARRDGWRPRIGDKPKIAATRDTIARLKGLLQQRLRAFETQLGSLGEEAAAASGERDIRAMNTLVRTLEKVLELERKDRASRAKRRKEHRALDDAERVALAERLAALQRGAAEDAEPPRGAGL